MTPDKIAIAIGNSSRADDGLGWAFLEAVSHQMPGDWTAEQRYQLVVEDAELLTGFDRVLFIDATLENLPGGFALEPCPPDPAANIYTHQQSPGAVLWLCQDLYGHRPDAWCLRIQGYAWELGNNMSPEAQQNLEAAVAGFLNWVAR